MVDSSVYKKGFTLIELLTVVSIIGLLSTVVLSSVNTAKAKARDATRLHNISQVKTALELYYSNFGFYPAIGCPSGCEGIVYPITQLTDPLETFIRFVPPDPSGATYLYQYTRNPPIYGYGLLMYLEKNSAYCKTGMNMDPAWWNSAPNCGF